MNTRVIRHADRQIYSRHPVVSVLKNGEPKTFELGSNLAAAGDGEKDRLS